MEKQLPQPAAEDLMKAIEAVDHISEQIREREADCLKRIFARFCLLKFKPLDPSAITIQNYDVRPNFTNYYYKFGTPDKYWLMSAETVIESGEYKLNIMFNPELVTNNEL